MTRAADRAVWFVAVTLAVGLLAVSPVVSHAFRSAHSAASYAAPTGGRSEPPAGQPPGPPAEAGQGQPGERVQPEGVRGEAEDLLSLPVLLDSLVRLPVAAALGAVLAFRPRRRGTPPRSPGVIQTQIILSIVGALVMLVVGASLARAFGIVGVASLIRYRAKIDDPKDAAVMLSTLGVGLASGSGLLGLAAFTTAFILVVLLLIESIDEGVKKFDLTVASADLPRLKPLVEAVLGRDSTEYEMRSTSEKEIKYAVTLPMDRTTDRVSEAIVRLARGAEVSLQWEERKLKP